MHQPLDNDAWKSLEIGEEIKISLHKHALKKFIGEDQGGKKQID
jgi:hypothetical protein